MEEYVCKLYGGKGESVDDVRYRKFKSKHERENKFVDISLIPPCKSVLLLHAKRASRISFLWKNTLLPMIEEPELLESGWEANGEIQWVSDIYPDKVNQILLISTMMIMMKRNTGMD